MKQTIAILGLAALLGACQQRQTQTAAAQATPAAAAPAAHAAAPSPEQLGALGAEIRKDPARGEELLAKHGLTRATFEQAIRAVTENADASRRYAEAYRKASA
jgi:hypothetical protein